ncbi:MAG: hypothetical protein SFX73_34760, partial [Kofleriaceae bacterium]|nr:hypothetical protein [Kofleriaceae bacterium]
PIDNSPTEREFQSFAKLRLNMLFAGSTEGAHRACVLLGIVATCRAIVSSVAEEARLGRLGRIRFASGLSLADGVVRTQLIDVVPGRYQLCVRPGDAELHCQSLTAPSTASDDPIEVDVSL